MILDERNEFCDTFAVPTATGTHVLGDQIPTGPGPLLTNIGLGEHIMLAVRVSQAFASAGAATVSFELVTDDNAALTSPTVIAATGPLSMAQLALGNFVFNMVLPRAEYEAFIGLRAVVATAALTAGRIDAFLANDTAQWRPYADAVN
jgi:hypothetical protein